MCNFYTTKKKAPTFIGTFLYLVAIAPKNNMPTITSPGVFQLNIPSPPALIIQKTHLNPLILLLLFIFVTK